MAHGKMRIGYAIVSKMGVPVTFDERMPIYWHKSQAVAEIMKREIGRKCQVVRVTIDTDD